MGISDPTVKIVVGPSRTELHEWLSYEIEADIRQPADAFSFRASNKGGELAGAVVKGDLVQVLVDGELVKTGRVDDVHYDTPQGGPPIVEITGRDLFGYLVDCSAPLKPLNKVTLLQLCQQLTTTWAISWSSQVTTAQISRVKIEPGETVWDVLSRFAAKEKVALWMDASGVAQIGKPNYTQAVSHKLSLLGPDNPLAHTRNNVLSASVRHSWRDQFSEVTVYGGTGNSSLDYGSSCRWKATAAEPEVANRPLRIVDGDCKSQSKAQARADVEVQRRKFDALTLQYTVKGHHGGVDGVAALWTVNTLCDVEDELSGQTGVFYISRVRFTCDENGRTATVEMHPKGVWLP